MDEPYFYNGNLTMIWDFWWELFKHYSLPLFIFIVLLSTAIWLTVFAVYSNIEAVNGSMATVKPTTFLAILSTELSTETSTELSTTTEIPQKEDSEFKNIFCWTSKSSICRKKKNKAQEGNLVTKNKP